MIRIDAIIPAALYTEKEAAPLLGKSLAWMRRCRWIGTGPVYLKQGRPILYRGSDLIVWLEQGAIKTVGGIDVKIRTGGKTATSAQIVSDASVRARRIGEGENIPAALFAIAHALQDVAAKLGDLADVVHNQRNSADTMATTLASALDGIAEAIIVNKSVG